MNIYICVGDGLPLSLCHCWLSHWTEFFGRCFLFTHQQHFKHERTHWWIFETNYLQIFVSAMNRSTKLQYLLPIDKVSIPNCWWWRCELIKHLWLWKMYIIFHHQSCSLSSVRSSGKPSQNGWSIVSLFGPISLFILFFFFSAFHRRCVEGEKRITIPPFEIGATMKHGMECHCVTNQNYVNG